MNTIEGLGFENVWVWDVGPKSLGFQVGGLRV